MDDLPTGIVTFLFTDVEGSTRRARELGDEPWAEVLELHRTILRDTFAAHGGHEVDTQGDSFFVAFERPTRAAECALAVQRALASNPWPHGAELRVRIGLHTGEAVVRGGGYVGQEVHRASRICDAGHGGQIVLSQTTADLVRERLADEAALVDLGRHRLKDLGTAQPLFQLSAKGLPAEFPPLRTLAASPNNLPAQRSSFVGREKEVAKLRSLLARHRLVTLAGVGGAGKTRLALQAGAEELGRFPDGVFFVDLAPISDPALVAQTFASAIGLSSGVGFAGVGSLPVEELLVEYLTTIRSLLLVDNCEHLLDPVCSLVDRILAECAGIVVCATSREPLGVEGEHVFRVPSLSLPDRDTDAEASESVRLFVERAASVHQGFAPAGDDLDAVAEICRRLDGIPLAIELAAARIAHLSPRQIAERLGDAFRLLTGGRRRVGRQQTLEATLDWSHDLLSPQEQAVFRRLGVFPGSFDLAAAEGVASDETMSSAAVLDLVGSLVSRSLLTTHEGSGGVVRYRLLETTRAYALTRLNAAGETADRLGRHRDHFLAWVEAMPFEMPFFSSEATRRFDVEMQNLRAAAEWSIGEDRPDLLGRLLSPAAGALWSGEQLRECYALLLRAVEAPERLSDPEQLACYSALSFASMQADDGRQAEFATRAIELSHGKEPTHWLIIALGTRILGRMASMVEGTRAADVAAFRQDGEQVVEVGRLMRSPVWLAMALLVRAWSTMLPEEAVPHLLAATEAIRGVTDRHLLTIQTLGSLAVYQHLRGDTEAALAPALECNRVIGEHRVGFADIYAAEIATVLAAGGRLDDARALLRPMLKRALQVKLPLYPNMLLCSVGAIAHSTGRVDPAARLLAASRYVGSARSAIRFRSPTGGLLYFHYVSLVREALGPDAARRARDEGRSMTTDEAIHYAIEVLEGA